MPETGKSWRHGIIGTHGSWLPGSPKGWRSRGHRVHSSGDYQQPPPKDEHAGLYRYVLASCPKAVTLPAPLRRVVGEAFVQELNQRGHRVLAIAIAGQHAHFLAELPIEKRAMLAHVGHAKRRSSRAVKRQLPGRVWATGGKFLVVGDEAYQRRVFDYICRHHDQGAWVWTFRDG